MRYKEFYLVIFMLIPFSSAQNLEERVVKLEKYIEGLEDMLVNKYGLIPSCQMPKPDHGRVICDTDELKKGAKCRVICNSGYIVTPGHSSAMCKPNGEWDVQLTCEVPVVVLSGGQIGEGTTDSSVEILDLESNKECKPIIPDMPLQNNSHRSFHNLIYDPEHLNLLACNGLSSVSVATCDAWKLKPTTTDWTFHSFPNKGSRFDMLIEDLNSKTNAFRGQKIHKLHPHKNKGRYAAESVTLGHRLMIIGGMVYDEMKHEATETVRAYEHSSNDPGWSGGNKMRFIEVCEMGPARAFFCSVKIDEYAVVNIGGFHNKTVLDDVQYRQCSRRGEMQDAEFYAWLRKRNRNVAVSNLPIPLSGHGCTTLPNSRDILVTGGQRFESDQTQSQTLIYSWNGDSWTKEWDMTEPRFGHKVFTVGDKVFAVGGRNKDSILDTIEQFDIPNRKWTKISKKLKKPRANFGLVLLPRSLLSHSCET